MKKLIKEYKKINGVEWIYGFLLSIVGSIFFIIVIYQY